MRVVATLVIALVLIQCALSRDCGGNCLSDTCDECHCGSSPSTVNITAICQLFPGWDSKCCECVVKRGSKGNANAANEREDGTIDIGLWQINSNLWDKCSGGTAPCSVQGNMDCAINLWKSGGGSFKVWNSCSSCGCCKSAVPSGLKALDAVVFQTKVPASTVKTPKRKKSDKQDIVISVEDENINSPLGNCGGNCPGNDCDSCPCGSTTSPQDISSWCSKFSGWDQSCCKCIVQHESGGNANAINENSNGSIDVGLWQINSVNWPSCSSNQPPCDPNTNLACAQKVYANGGNTFKQWTTCTACGCCNSTTGGTTGPSTHTSNTNTGPSTHTSNTNTGPSTHTSNTNSGPSTHTSNTNGPSTSSSTYSSAFFEANLPNGGHGNQPLGDIKNVIFNNKKK